MKKLEGQIPFEKVIKGNFYQVKLNEAERLANRIFQIYDKDANGKINFRESKHILRDIYPKGVKFTDEDYKQFFQILNQHQEKDISLEDFQKLVEKYFTNDDKQGSLDKQTVNPEIYDLDLTQNKTKDQIQKKETITEIRKKLVNESKARYGGDFTDYQLKQCKKIFDDHNTSNKEQLDFDEMQKIFEFMFKKIKFLKANESIDRDDVERLMTMINYNKDNKVTYDEFELFYLKSILGS